MIGANPDFNIGETKMIKRTISVLLVFACQPVAVAGESMKCESRTLASGSPSNNIDWVFGDSDLIKRGYTLVSGGCIHEDWRAGDQSMMLGSYPTEGNQWRCWFKNPRATTLKGYVKYCSKD